MATHRKQKGVLSRSSCRRHAPNLPDNSSRHHVEPTWGAITYEYIGQVMELHLYGSSYTWYSHCDTKVFESKF